MNVMECYEQTRGTVKSIYCGDEVAGMIAILVIALALYLHYKFGQWTFKKKGEEKK